MKFRVGDKVQPEKMPRGEKYHGVVTIARERESSITGEWYTIAWPEREDQTCGEGLRRVISI